MKDRVGPLCVDIAESLNNYFSSVFTLEDTGKLPTIPKMIGENEECKQHNYGDNTRYDTSQT